MSPTSSEEDEERGEEADPRDVDEHEHDQGDVDGAADQAPEESADARSRPRKRKTAPDPEAVSLESNVGCGPPRRTSPWSTPRDPRMPPKGEVKRGGEPPYGGGIKAALPTRLGKSPGNGTDA